MTRTVHCAKLKKDAEGLDFPPFPGPQGERIFNNVSKEAWQAWLKHQTILINEYRLNVLDPESKALLKKEREKFLFGDGAELPKEFNPKA